MKDLHGELPIKERFLFLLFHMEGDNDHQKRDPVWQIREEIGALKSDVLCLLVSPCPRFEIGTVSPVSGKKSIRQEEGKARDGSSLIRMEK